MSSGITILLTDAAAAALRRDLRPDEQLRIAFAGGCGAMGFRIAPSRRPAADDVALDVGGAGDRLKLFLDRRAVAELDGATLDYDVDEGFLLDHPQWGLSC